MSAIISTQHTHAYSTTYEHDTCIHIKNRRSVWKTLASSVVRRLFWACECGSLARLSLRLRDTLCVERSLSLARTHSLFLSVTPHVLAANIVAIAQHLVAALRYAVWFGAKASKQAVCTTTIHSFGQRASPSVPVVPSLTHLHTHIQHTSGKQQTNSKQQQQHQQRKKKYYFSVYIGWCCSDRRRMCCIYS